MRFRCVLLSALALLTLALAANAEPVDDAAWLTNTVAEADGEGCTLIDVPADDPEGAAAAIRAAGFIPTPTPAQLPQCPTHFACNSIGNCASGPLCSITDIGACCRVSPTLIRCCISGTIKVVRCPCQCTATICAISCVQSQNVTSSCS